MREFGGSRQVVLSVTPPRPPRRRPSRAWSLGTDAGCCGVHESRVRGTGRLAKPHAPTGTRAISARTVVPSAYVGQELEHSRPRALRVLKSIRGPSSIRRTLQLARPTPAEAPATIHGRRGVRATRRAACGKSCNSTGARALDSQVSTRVGPQTHRAWSREKLDFGTKAAAATRMNSLSNTSGTAPALLELLPAFPRSRGPVPNRSMAHASEALLFGAALCLVSAPALLGSGLDDIQDDPLRVRQTAQRVESVPLIPLVPARRIESDAQKPQPTSVDPARDPAARRR